MPMVLQTNTIDNDEEKRCARYIESFGGYCNKFYHSSLSLTSKKDHDPTVIISSDSKSCDTEALNTAKVVLEVFDYCLLLREREDFEQKLLHKSEVKKKLPALLSCGLISLRDETTETYYFPEIPNNLLLKYVEMRDSQRRKSHLANMRARKKILMDFIERGEEINSRSGIKEGEASETSDNALALKATRRSHLKSIRKTLRGFVSKYKNDIGAHPFLAGVRKIFETQLCQENSRVLLWIFNEAVLSDTVSTSNESTSEQYIKDSVEFLLSFMVRLKDGEDGISDVETGDLVDIPGRNNQSNSSSPDKHDSFLIFYIDPVISDLNLKILKDEFPKSFDAKPTGRFTTANGKVGGKELVRSNVNGELDEHGFGLGHFLSFPCAVL